MTTDPTTPGRGDERLPDPHGAAALLIVESLVHTLAARAILSAADAVDVVQDARDVHEALMQEVAAPSPTMVRTADLIDEILASLRIDLGGKA